MPMVVWVMAANTRLDLLSNELLLERTRALVGSASRNLADLLRHLAEVESRKLYRDQACSCMFRYCTDRLGFSEGAAFKRIAVARLSRRFPMILEMVADGRLHLGKINALASVLTRENHASLVEQAVVLNTRRVESLAAGLQPQEDVPDRIRKLRDRDSTGSPVARQVANASDGSTEHPVALHVESGLGGADAHGALDRVANQRHAIQNSVYRQRCRSRQAASRSGVDGRKRERYRERYRLRSGPTHQSARQAEVGEDGPRTEETAPDEARQPAHSESGEADGRRARRQAVHVR